VEDHARLDDHSAVGMNIRVKSLVRGDHGA
jgi:hypothetical protein